MLSKVLSAREGQRAQPIVFAPLLPSQVPSLQPPRRREPEPRNEAELTALQQRIRALESEVVAARREGHEAGVQQGRGEIAPVLERMNASVAEIASLKPELRRRAEKDVVQLAMLIARRVLHREVSMDSNALSALARLSFERLSRAETCRIVVHPQFAAAIAGALPASQSARIQIEPDPNCPPGTLVFHSDAGVIDASIETQLDEINRGLTDRLIGS